MVKFLELIVLRSLTSISGQQRERAMVSGWMPPSDFEAPYSASQSLRSLSGSQEAVSDGKELWHIMLPSEMEPSTFDLVPLNSMMNQEPVLVCNGNKFAFRLERTSMRSKTFLVPVDGRAGFTPTVNHIRKTLRLERAAELPSPQKNKAAPLDGCDVSNFHRSIPKQPHRLILKCHPIGDVKRPVKNRYKPGARHGARPPRIPVGAGAAPLRTKRKSSERDIGPSDVHTPLKKVRPEHGYKSG